MENKDAINSIEEVTDIMIDIESLGNAGKFVVTEVSFVPFNINKGIIFSETYSFSVSICVQDSLEKGFKINPDTVAWWITTNIDLFKKQLDGKLTISKACGHITDYLNVFPNIERFWATAVLDYQGISNLFDSVNLPNPIPYNQRLCARTHAMMAKILLGDEKAPKRPNNHISEQDCINQILEIMEDHQKLLKK